MTSLHFPGAVGLTHLRVYSSIGSDGLIGGSPHMHLVSTEAYVPTSGSGAVQTFSADGLQTHRLQVGDVVWFEPGVIHRLINTGTDLEILVVMQNAGLPEAGDAVFTFTDEVMTDQDRYDQAAALPAGDTETRFRAAQRRRDLAILGFNAMIEDDEPTAALDRFHGIAIARKQQHFDRWSDLLRTGSEAETYLTRQRLEALIAGSSSMLQSARLATSDGGGNEHPAIGMCGTLRQYEPLARSSN